MKYVLLTLRLVMAVFLTITLVRGRKDFDLYGLKSSHISDKFQTLVSGRWVPTVPLPYSTVGFMMWSAIQVLRGKAQAIVEG